MSGAHLHTSDGARLRGAPSVGTACALVMKQRVRLSDPVQLILEENVGPVMVDVAQRNWGFHGTLMLSGKICLWTASALRYLAVVAAPGDLEFARLGLERTRWLG